MASIALSLQRIKDNPLGLLSSQLIEGTCREHGYTWRDRELDPTTTMGLFMQQVLHGNASCSEVVHIGGNSFTPQAYCDARARLPLAVYQDLLSKVSQAVMPQTGQEEHLWHGHRTFHVDEL